MPRGLTAAQGAGNQDSASMSRMGAILCENCATGADSHVKLSQGSIRLYESLRKWDNSLAGRIKPSGNLLAELSGMINDHIRYTLSKPLKSEAFYNLTK